MYHEQEPVFDLRDLGKIEKEPGHTGTSRGWGVCLGSLCVSSLLYISKTVAEILCPAGSCVHRFAAVVGPGSERKSKGGGLRFGPYAARHVTVISQKY